MVRALASHQCGPGSNFRRRSHVWVEFVVGSLLCFETFFSGYSGFLLSSITNISKFQFDQESGRRKTTLWICYLQIIIIIIILLLHLKKRTKNSTGIRENWINCLLYKVLLYLHIFLVLNNNCTEPYLVRYVEALYIYTQIKIIVQFLRVNPSKNSPHWSNINMQKVFRRRYAIFMFNLWVESLKRSLASLRRRYTVFMFNL